MDYEDIHTEGITDITATDIRYASAMGRVIRLLASSKKTENGYAAMVAPFLLPPEHPLYSVNDVFNAVFVHGNVLGDAMFYGSGAGKLPTASAVVADIVEIARHPDAGLAVDWSTKKIELADFNSIRNRFFVRTTAERPAIRAVFGDVEYIVAEGISGERGFLTEELSEAAFAAKAEQLQGILQRIRIA